MKTRLNKHGISGKQMIGLLLVPALLAGCKGQSGQMGGSTPEYAVAVLEPTVNNLQRSFPATIQGKQDVEIRPNVSGFITKLCVDEGAAVSKGQTLFIIDQVPYKAALEAAEAAVGVAKAAVNTSELTVENKRELYKRNIISEYDLQMAENTLASQQAQLAQAEAQATNAANNLSYTQVKSPSDGVIGTIPFRLGSLVSPSSATPLTTVSDISEMFVYFSMNEKQLLELTRQAGSMKTVIDSMPAIELQLADGSIYPEKGKIDMVSGVIDPSTGAVSMRAVFPNKSNVLRSGGSGSVLIPYTLDNSLTVPQSATFEIQNKRFVYVFQPDSTIKNTEIQVFEIDNGKNFVITGGIGAGDRIVMEGVSSLKDGMKIKPITQQEAAAKVKAMTEAAAAAAQQKK